jgi:S1-C subfamily serine protease
MMRNVLARLFVLFIGFFAIGLQASLAAQTDNNAATSTATNTAKSTATNSAQALAYASGLIEDGLYEAALASLRQAPMGSDAQVGEVFLEMAKLYAALGNTARALDAVDQARSLLPNATPRLQIEQARLHIVVGNLVHARSMLSALAGDADAPQQIAEDVVLLRARAQLAVGGLAAAQAALQAGPQGERLTLEQVRLFESQNNAKQANDLLTGFVKASPDSGRSWLKLAELYKATGQAQEAGEALAQARRVFNAQKDAARLQEVKRVEGMAVVKVEPPKVEVRPQAAAPAAPVPTPATPPATAKPTAPAASPPASAARASPPPATPQAVVPAPPPAASAPPVAVTPAPTPAPPPPAKSPTIIAQPFPFPPGTKVETGSGFVVDSGRRVITNRHVVENSTEIYVRNSLGNLSRVRIESMSKTDDLAVLVLQEPFPAERAIAASQFGPARAGASIAVLGFPLINILGSVTPSITNGIVIKETGMQDAPEMFQLSAKMNKGNSGGAVVDSRGRVVGIAMGKLDVVKVMQGDGFLPEDVNFAIHIKRLSGLGVPIQPASHQPAELSLEEIYQRFIGSVVMVAAR